jgi:hypothetical protein
MTNLPRNASNLLAAVQAELRQTMPTDETRLKDLHYIKQELERRIAAYNQLSSEDIVFYVSIPPSVRKLEQEEERRAKIEKRQPSFWPKGVQITGTGPGRFMRVSQDMGDDFEWWLDANRLSYQELES